MFIQGDSLSASPGPDLIMVFAQCWVISLFRSHVHGLLSVAKKSEKESHHAGGDGVY